MAARTGDGSDEFVVFATDGTRTPAGGRRVLATVTEDGGVSVHDQATRSAVVREYLDAAEDCRRACEMVPIGSGGWQVQHVDDCKAVAYGID